MLVHATDSSGVTRSIALQHTTRFQVFAQFETEEITLPDKLDARLVSKIDGQELVLSDEIPSQLLQLAAIADFLQDPKAVDQVLETIAMRLQVGLDRLEAYQTLEFYDWHWDEI